MTLAKAARALARESYMLKFSKGGSAKLHEDDLGLIDDEEEHAGAELLVVQAGVNA